MPSGCSASKASIVLSCAFLFEYETAPIRYVAGDNGVMADGLRCGTELVRPAPDNKGIEFGPLSQGWSTGRFGGFFAGVFVQVVPFLALGVLVSGGIAALVSPAVLRKSLPRNESAAVGVAVPAGMALPGCECGVVPVARRLTDQGAPDSVALAFMLSAPAINPVVLIATAVAFPGEPGMVAARFTGSLATAVVMGLIWSKIGRPAWALPRGRGPNYCVTSRTRWEVFTEAARHDCCRPARFSCSALRPPPHCTCWCRPPGTNSWPGRW